MHLFGDKEHSFDSAPGACQTQIVKIDAIHHIQLAMPSGGEGHAVAFYEGILDVPRVEKPAHLASRGGCWFESGNVRIHLGVDQDFRPARKAHPALIVSDLDEARAHFVASGIGVVDDEALPGFDRFYVSDPFGNRLEILAVG
jgi:catechol 2,3-dioxygenase-like lactoylglutathione lyase family enzyme